MNSKLLEAVRGKIKHRGSIGYEDELLDHIAEQELCIDVLEAAIDDLVSEVPDELK